MDEGAILHESRVERDKGAVLVAGVSAQVGFYNRWMTDYCRRKATNLHPLRQRCQGRESFRVMTVHENQLMLGQLSKHDRRKNTGLHSGGLGTGMSKPDLGDRSDTGVFPLFVPRRGQTDLGKAGDRRLAQRSGPRPAVSNGLALKPLEVRAVMFLSFFQFHHHPGVSRGDSRDRAGLEALLNPTITLLLELVRQLFSARHHDVAVREHMHVVGDDIVQQPLIVSDENHRTILAPEFVDAMGYDL